MSTGFRSLGVIAGPLSSGDAESDFESTVKYKSSDLSTVTTKNINLDLSLTAKNIDFSLSTLKPKTMALSTKYQELPTVETKKPGWSTVKVRNLKPRLSVDEQTSRELSWILDQLGYSTRQRQFRRESYRACDNTANEKSKKVWMFEQFTAGSKGEGLTNFYESDMDILYIYRNIVCLDEKYVDWFKKELVTLFTLDTENCYPGYTRLKLHSFAKNVDAYISNSIYHDTDSGIRYLSRDKFLQHHSEMISNMYSSDTVVVHNVQGPATPTTRRSLDIDRVFSMRCDCRSIIRNWQQRPRKYNWPKPEMIRSLEYGNLVAAGSKLGFKRDLEFRFCFNKIEVQLLGSLNDTQVKLYISLKMIVKDVIKPENKAITSYMLKNIVFWLAEMHPQEEFTNETLLTWLRKALVLLKRAIRSNIIPYYMIPERNLMETMMPESQRKSFVSIINVLLSSGTNVILACPKLSSAISSFTPDQLSSFGKWRNEIEMLKINRDNYMLEIEALNREERIKKAANDDVFNELSQKMMELVLPAKDKLTVPYNLMESVVQMCLEQILK